MSFSLCSITPWTKLHISISKISYPPQYFDVRVGSIQRITGGQLVPLSQIIIHKNYSSSDAAGTNDLALLKLQSKVNLNANTKPIDLATERPAAGSQISFSGWGSSKANISEFVNLV